MHRRKEGHGGGLKHGVGAMGASWYDAHLQDLIFTQEMPMVTMRAKVKVTKVERYENVDSLIFTPVCKTGAYPADGSDEDNTFAKFSPAGEFKLSVTNPALVGKFVPGQKFYVDFTQIEDVPSEVDVA